MTTVVQATTQPGGYQPQQQGYPQQGYPQQQPPPTIIQAPQTTYNSGSNPSKNERYNKKAGLVTGVLQILAGGLIVLLGIVVLVLGSWFRLSWSIWGGICFYVVTGILGVVSKNQSKYVIIVYMVMNIISAVCAGSQMIYDATAASTSRLYGGYFCGGSYNYYGYYSYNASCGKMSAIIAMHSLSALVALGEMIIAIVASAYCCAGYCGTTASTLQTTVVAYAQPNPQVTVISPGGYSPATTYPQAAGGAYPQVPPGQPPNYTQQQPTYEGPMKGAM